jgi:hypothetical protein
MANSDSDAAESTAYNFIQFIPVVNAAYSAVRAVVYATKGNTHEVGKSCIGIGTGLAGKMNRGEMRS